MVVSPKILRILWEKDAETGGATSNDVQWCEECATQRVDAQLDTQLDA